MRTVVCGVYLCQRTDAQRRQGQYGDTLRGLFGCVAGLLPFAPTRLWLKQGARWQQLYSPLDGRSANVTVLALPPLGWLLNVVGFASKIHFQRLIIPEV